MSSIYVGEAGGYDRYSCDICRAEESFKNETLSLVLPPNWEPVSGFDVCAKCCKIMRAFVANEV